NDQLEVVVVLRNKTLERLTQVVFAVVNRHADAHERPIAHRGCLALALSAADRRRIARGRVEAFAALSASPLLRRMNAFGQYVTRSRIAPSLNRNSGSQISNSPCASTKSIAARRGLFQTQSVSL